MEKVIMIETDRHGFEGIFSSIEMAWKFFVNKYDGNQIITKKDFFNQVNEFNYETTLTYNNPERRVGNDKYRAYHSPQFADGVGQWHKGENIYGIKFYMVKVDEEVA